MKEDIQIIICGDICPTPDTENLFENEDALGLFNDVLPLLQKADITIGNLEFPLTDVGKGINKTGPVLKGKKKYINVIKKAEFDVLGLANNHIRDCGDEGVLSTLESCKNAGIKTVGGGVNSGEAKQPLIIEKKGWKIGVIAYAEHEFNAATDHQAGANLFDVFESFDLIKEVKEKVDYLIILNHGGIEYYEYPSPLLQKKCKKMVECGADLVVCQHSHCIGTKENYLNGNIIYGQGNTVFGYRKNSESWNQGLVINVTLRNNPKQEAFVKYIPIEASASGINLMPRNKGEIVLAKLEEDSKKITNTSFINSSWIEFCKKKESHYLPLLLGLGRILNKANRLLKNRIIHILYSQKRMMITKNLIRCESHNEVVQTILNNK